MSNFQSSKYILYEQSTTTPTKTTRITQLPTEQNVFLLPDTHIEYYITKGLFENDLIDWSKQFCSKSKTTLDIGAHTGTYAVNLASVSKNVICFEPQKATYYALCGSVALSNLSDSIDCYQIGLGNETQIGKKPLYIISPDGGGSSLIRSETMEKDGSKTLKTETVEIRTLDSFELDNIGFIKIDVEQNELYVLEGAKKTLERCNYPSILFESNFHDPELFAFLKELSYEVHTIRGYSYMYIAVSTRKK